MLSTLDIYIFSVYIQYMNIDNLTTAEINFVKNLLSGISDAEVIADQTTKTVSDSFNHAEQVMTGLGYKWDWYKNGRTTMRAMFLKGKSNMAMFRDLADAFRQENQMQLLWSPERMASNDYQYKVERNTGKSYIKVASQLVERGLLEGTMVVHIARGEGIAETLIAIRNM